jgi:hypothetical protein
MENYSGAVPPDPARKELEKEKGRGRTEKGSRKIR